MRSEEGRTEVRHHAPTPNATGQPPNRAVPVGELEKKPKQIKRTREPCNLPVAPQIDSACDRALTSAPVAPQHRVYTKSVATSRRGSCFNFGPFGTMSTPAANDPARPVLPRPPRPGRGPPRGPPRGPRPPALTGAGSAPIACASPLLTASA